MRKEFALATRQRKVERQRRKRQEKQREKRRFALTLQKQQVSDAYPVHACYGNSNWRDEGIATVLFGRELSQDRVTLVAFCVDLWGMGLKDAWGRTGITAGEFQEAVDRMKEAHPMAPMNPGVARHIVFGGIERATELGFRLPPRLNRWTGVLGALPEDESPDRSLFGVNGKVRLICNARDLEARLIGCTSKQFLARPDVEYVIGSDDFTLVNPEDDETADHLEQLADTMYEEARKWCFANGQIPHPLLRKVIESALDALIDSIPEDVDLEADWDTTMADSARQQIGCDLLDNVGSVLHENPIAAHEAFEQFRQFAAQADDPLTMLQRQNRNV